MNAFVAKWTVKLSSESCSLTINHKYRTNTLKMLVSSCNLSKMSVIYSEKKKVTQHYFWPREGLGLLTRKSTLNHFCCKFWHFTCSIHPTLPWSWERPALLAKGLLASCNFPVCHHPSCLFCTCKIQKYSFLLYL